MTDSPRPTPGGPPLYDATLSDLLLHARRTAERAQAKAALAARRAAEEADRARHEAAILVARAHKAAAAHAAAQVARESAELRRRAEHEARQERVRRALVAEQVEERVRTALVSVPPLPPLAGRTAAVDGPAEDVEQEAPPVPSMEELLRPTPGVTRFLDALLGPSKP